MRILALALVACAILAVSPPRAEAQNYPWCALYRDGGAQNCGFTSFEQCMETVRGAGAFCNENTQYVARPAPSPRRR